jgi:hypothetical protein
MYRSLSDRGSLTEYVYVMSDPNANLRLVLKVNLSNVFLGHRICPNSLRGTRFPLGSIKGPVYTFLLSRTRTRLGRRARPRYSCRSKEIHAEFVPSRSISNLAHDDMKDLAKSAGCPIWTKRRSSCYRLRHFYFPVPGSC